MTYVGELALWVALLMAAWSTTVSFVGAAQHRVDLVQSGERAMYATCACLAAATIGIWSALFARDLSLLLVAMHITTNLSARYLGIALWADTAGKLLWWTLCLSLYAAFAVWSAKRPRQRETAWVTGTLAAVCLCALLVMCFGANPYARLDWTPLDGRGLEPTLQQLGRGLHTPLLLFGLAATSIPFAVSLVALASRRVETSSIELIRRWTMVAWCVLTAGMALGMHSAYRERGGASEWAWDAIDNVSVLPWLAASALLHSIVVLEKRAQLVRWNLAIGVATFPFAIIAAFVRPGDSSASAHDRWILASVLVLSALLVSVALRVPTASSAPLAGWRNREGVLWCLSATGVAAGLVMLSALIVATFGGSETRLAVSDVLRTPTSTIALAALGVVWMLVTGIAPLVAWRRASWPVLRARARVPVALGGVSAMLLWVLGVRDVYVLIALGALLTYLAVVVHDTVSIARARRRIHDESLIRALRQLIIADRRRYGGYVVQVGVLLACVAFAALRLSSVLTQNVRTGDVISASDVLGQQWTFTSQGVSQFSQPDRHVVVVSFRVARDGRLVGLLQSEQRQYLDAGGRRTFEPLVLTGRISSPTQDVLLSYRGAADADHAAVKIRLIPIASVLWVSAMVMLLGGATILWPRARLADGAR